MRPPFVTINAPERGGARHVEALAQDVIDRCYRENPEKFTLLCHGAIQRGLTLRQFVEDRVRDLLQTVIQARLENQDRAPN